MGFSKAMPLFNFRTCPAVAAAVWLIFGILLVLSPFLGLLPWSAAAAAVLCAGVLLWLVSSSVARRLVWLMPLGAALAALHIWAPWQSYRQQLPRPECGAEIEAIVTEPVFTGEALPEMAPPPTMRVALRRLRLDPQRGWIPCRGALLMRLPRGAPAPRYGETIWAEGGFALPEAGCFAGDFNYRAYLLTTGVRHLFVAAGLKSIAPCRGWYRLPAFCLGLRDHAMQRLAAGMRSPQNVQLLSAILFGYRAALDPAVRNNFLRSGTIHIFSVSGLHVVILGSIFLLLLKLAAVPFRWRHFILPFMLGVYTLMTGAAPCAVRAWIMISAWAVTRGMLWPLSSLNSVAVAAVVLLLVNPLSLAQIGFQFSFILVLALILGWEPLSYLRAVAFEKARWIPPRCQRHPGWRQARSRLLDSITGSALAWLASAGLILWTNARLIPASLGVNIGMGIASWLVLFTATVKLGLSLLFSWLTPWPDLLLGRLLEFGLAATRWLAEIGSRSPGSLAVPRPALGLVLLFYALLFLVFCPRLKRAPRLLATAASLAVLVIAVTHSVPAPAIAVFSGNGSALPGIVVAGRTVPPIVVNAGEGVLSRSMAQWLAGRGAGRLESLIVSRSESVFGSARLLDALEIGSVVLPAPRFSGRGQSPLAISAAEDGTRVRFLPAPAAGVASVSELAWGACAVGRSEDAARQVLRFRLDAPADNVDIEIETFTCAGSVLRIRRAGRVCDTYRFPLARDPALTLIPL